MIWRRARALSLLIVTLPICLTFHQSQVGASPNNQLPEISVIQVSVDSEGEIGNNGSHSPDVGDKGRLIAFYSGASNLVPNDTNRRFDIFVRDLVSKVTERVSLASDGTQSNDNSRAPALSENGQFVAFDSLASNIVGDDTNGVNDVFVHDRISKITQRVSTASDGSQGNDKSLFPSISDDGRFVVFESHASNLVPGDSNGVPDIFLHDRQSGVTERVSITLSNGQGNGESRSATISGDGRFVAFESLASNLTVGDTNGARDVFVYDRLAETTERTSVSSMGNEADSGSFIPSISSSARFVAFESFATNLVAGDTNGRFDIYVVDRDTGKTELASLSSDGEEGNHHSRFPSLSADGRFLAFESQANNLVANDTNSRSDVFIRDLKAGITQRVSVSKNGVQADFGSLSPDLSHDGRAVAFVSQATDLVADDTNREDDIFVASNPLFEPAGEPDEPRVPDQIGSPTQTVTVLSSPPPPSTPGQPTSGGGCSAALGPKSVDLGIIFLILAGVGLHASKRR